MARRSDRDTGEAGGTDGSTAAHRDHRFDPSSALRPQRSDAYAVLVLWCVRKSFFPLLWIGLTVAVWALRDVDAVLAEIEGLGDVGSMVSDLVSPFGFVVLAVGLRLIANWVALAAAYPLTRWTHATDYARGRKRRSWIGLWWDRLYLARGFRSLRWTSPVRRVAQGRLGPVGEAFRVATGVITWSGVVSVLAFVAVVLAVEA